MYYDRLITLRKVTDYTVDDIGNEKPVFSESEAWCGELSVTQSEFYSAASRSFKPEKVIEVWDRDYSGENRCIYEGTDYEIYRSFHKSSSTKRELYLRLPRNEYQN